MKRKNFRKGHSAFVFRHFACKRWSLFAVMGQEVKVGVLSVATLAVAAAAQASAAQQAGKMGSAATSPPTDSTALADDAVALGEAAVIAQHAPLPAEMAARLVTCFTRNDIAAAGARTINDIVKLCAAVDVRQRGPHGVQTDISVGGGTFDQVTVLLNGINITSPHTGHLTADFPLSADDIERVEVLEGAAARSCGTTAFTGVINIVTRQERRGVLLQAAGGMY